MSTLHPGVPYEPLTGVDSPNPSLHRARPGVEEVGGGDEKDEELREDCEPVVDGEHEE